MAFIPHIIGNTEQTAFEYLPCDNITVYVGMALVLSGGILVAATGTTAPTYFSMTAKTCEQDEIIPVTPVRKDIIYETINQAVFTSVVPGDLVTLHTDAMQVTATETNGVATVVSFPTAAVTATGEKILVRF